MTYKDVGWDFHKDRVGGCSIGFDVGRDGAGCLFARIIFGPWWLQIIRMTGHQMAGRIVAVDEVNKRIYIEDV